jgi:hypothetical protein
MTACVILVDESLRTGVGDEVGYICQFLSLGLGLSMSEESTTACPVPVDQSLRTACGVELDSEGKSNLG